MRLRSSRQIEQHVPRPWDEQGLGATGARVANRIRVQGEGAAGATVRCMEGGEEELGPPGKGRGLTGAAGGVAGGELASGCWRRWEEEPGPSAVPGWKHDLPTDWWEITRNVFGSAHPWQCHWLRAV